MSEKPEQQPQSDQEPVPVGEISQQPSALEEFLDANQKKLILAGIALIVALVAYVVIDGLAQQRIEDESAAVVRAETSDSPVVELEKIASENAGTNAAGTALIHKARHHWENLQQEQAIETLEKFINEYPEHPAYASGLASIASYYQNMGKIDEAKEYYTKAAEEKAAASSLALISLGDIARNEGDEEAAKSYYDRATAEFGQIHSGIKSLAEQRSKLLGVKPPTEVKPAPPAPKTPTPTPGVPSNPVKVNPLPKAPEQPKKTATEAPKPTTPAPPKTPEPPKPEPTEPETTEPETSESSEPESDKSTPPADPSSN